MEHKIFHCPLCGDRRKINIEHKDIHKYYCGNCKTYFCLLEIEEYENIENNIQEVILKLDNIMKTFDQIEFNNKLKDYLILKLIKENKQLKQVGEKIVTTNK